MQYTGDGNSTQEIEHDLECVPGMIVVKSNSDVGPNGAHYNAFVTWHRGYNNYDPDMYITRLNYQSFDSASNYWNNTSPTATKFTVGSALNYSGVLYNVYIWGHNEAAEDCIFGEEENKPLIFCGYCPDAPSDPHYPEIDCGMPAQFLLHKNCQQLDNNAYADSWRISDKLRGMRFHAGGPWFPLPYDEEQVNTSAAAGKSGFGVIRGSEAYWTPVASAITYLDQPGAGTHTYKIQGISNNSASLLRINMHGNPNFYATSQMTIQKVAP